MKNTIFNIVKYETKVKGYWKDESGKIFVDNIETIKAENAGQFENVINTLFLKGEKCVFVLGNEKAFILYPEGKTETLENKTQYNYSKIYFLANEKQLIFNLFTVHNGFTVYETPEGFTVESWN